VVKTAFHFDSDAPRHALRFQPARCCRVNCQDLTPDPYFPCWQNLPQPALPEELHDDNPRKIMRTVNGVLTR
jgi:hypothetical protein